MSQYRAYPAYKDSGVEWIGQVPEHWEVKPICRVTSVNDDVLPDSTTDDTPIRYVDISSVGYMEGIKQASDMCFADAPSRARRKASSGDVIISTVRTYLKAVAAVTDEYADCVFSTGFAVLRARHLDRSFLKWMVLNELLIQAIEAHSEGLSYPAINASALVKLKSVIPPPEEQASIAATLDRETARIDALIQKKTRFIELLKEKRQALITHAVTKGLDPNVKMKDSGVEWIGQVPEHWKIAPVKYHYDARLGKMIQPAAVSDRDIEVPYHRAQTVQWERIVESDIKEMWASPRDIEQFSVSEGDLLICEGGDVCRAAIVKQPPEKNMIFQNSIHRIRSKGEYGVGWVMRLMQHLRSSEWIDVLCNKNTIVHFTSDKLGSLECPLPPPDEQASIAATLDHEIARIDALIGKAEQSITLLKERRAAFITAAVTGQIDLRGKQ